MYQNWTDDIPVCRLSDVGKEDNYNYKTETHNASEDRHFRLACPNNCFLYGVFDGHDGARVANFAQQKLPAELILGQLKDGDDDKNICERLRDAFESVAKEFVDGLINKSLMQKMELMERIPKGMSKAEIQQRYFSLYEQLQEYDREIAGGCTAVVALIHKNRLFLANVGDARAILCRQDGATGEIGIVQLTIDHTTSTESELQRLMRLGLEEKLEELQTSDIVKTTRSIGDWVLKNEYKDIELLKDAKEEPIISVPSIHGGELINSSMKFLIMMSRGVYATYKEATGVSNKQLNNAIVNLVIQELYITASVHGVAQRVIKQICSLHKSAFDRHRRYPTRSDMTLIVRIFNVDDEPKLGDKSKSSEGTKKSHERNLPPLKIGPRTTIASTTSTPSSTGSNTPTTVTPGTPGSSGNPSPTTNPFARINNQTPQTVTSDEQLIASQMEDLHTKDRQCNVRRPLFQISHNAKNIMEPLHIDTRDLPFGPTIGVVQENKPDQAQGLASSQQSENTSNTSSIEDKTLLFNRPAEPLEIDENGRVKPYVDFSDFFEKVNQHGGEKEVLKDFFP